MSKLDATDAASARELPEAMRLARIAPTPKQMLTALDRLRRLDRRLRAAGDEAFDAQAAALPAASLAAIVTAEEKLADAERVIRGEIARLESHARRVSYRPAPNICRAAVFQFFPVDGGRR